MMTARAKLAARDVMTAEPVCVEPATTIRELARVFEEHEISGAPVVDARGALVGVVSKTDLIRKCSEGTLDVPPAYLFEVLSEQGASDEASEVMPEALVCVEDFMTEDPATVVAETPVAEIARTMSEGSIHRVIVVDRSGFPIPVGIVTSLDLLRRWSD